MQERRTSTLKPSFFRPRLQPTSREDAHALFWTGYYGDVKTSRLSDQHGCRHSDVDRVELFAKIETSWIGSLFIYCGYVHLLQSPEHRCCGPTGFRVIWFLCRAAADVLRRRQQIRHKFTNMHHITGDFKAAGYISHSEYSVVVSAT